jgi:hypothetical protein
VLFISNALDFKPETVVLDVSRTPQKMANDYLDLPRWHAPTDFLKKIGVDFGMRDMTLEPSQEARRVVLDRQRPGQAPAAVPGEGVNGCADFLCAATSLNDD